jgi:hypothetical protein
MGEGERGKARLEEAIDAHAVFVGADSDVLHRGGGLQGRRRRVSLLVSVSLLLTISLLIPLLRRVTLPRLEGRAARALRVPTAVFKFAGFGARRTPGFAVRAMSVAPRATGRVAG